MTGGWRFVREHYVVLPLGAVIGIAWANTSGDSYFRFAQALAFPVNAIGMAFVLAYVAQEVFEAILPGGSLHPRRGAAVALIAAAGGIVGSGVAYAAYIDAHYEQVLAQGWPIACAADILFSLAIARAIYRRTAAVTFLLLVAIATDVFGLVVISRHDAAATLHPFGGALIVPAIIVALALRRRHVRAVGPYVWIAGSLSWIACYSVGVHPSLALLPIVPFFTHTARDLSAVRGGGSRGHRTNGHFEYAFEYPVQAIAFAFGLVNGGALLRGYDTGTWAVLTASLVGRPIGILVAVAAAKAAGLRFPRHIGWRDVIVIAFAVAPSLAFGVFVATAVFPSGPLLIETKLGAMATAGGALLALAAARLLHVGRFATVAAMSPPARAHTAGERA
jgi:NhaA family Na+:H+ antiporter